MRQLKHDEIAVRSIESINLEIDKLTEDRIKLFKTVSRLNSLYAKLDNNDTEALSGLDAISFRLYVENERITESINRLTELPISNIYI